MSKDAFDKIAEGLNEALATTRGEGEVIEDAVDWKITSGLSKPTYEQLEAFCAQLADENARLRRQLELADGVRSVQYDGVRVFITEDAPPIIWNGKEATVLEFGEVVDALHVALKETV